MEFSWKTTPHYGHICRILVPVIWHLEDAKNIFFTWQENVDKQGKEHNYLLETHFLASYINKID